MKSIFRKTGLPLLLGAVGLAGLAMISIHYASQPVPDATSDLALLCSWLVVGAVVWGVYAAVAEITASEPSDEEQQGSLSYDRRREPRRAA